MKHGFADHVHRPFEPLATAALVDEELVANVDAEIGEDAWRKMPVNTVCGIAGQRLHPIS